MPVSTLITSHMRKQPRVMLCAVKHRLKANREALLCFYEPGETCLGTDCFKLGVERELLAGRGCQVGSSPWRVGLAATKAILGSARAPNASAWTKKARLTKTCNAKSSHSTKRPSVLGCGPHTQSSVSSGLFLSTAHPNFLVGACTITGLLHFNSTSEGPRCR